MLAAIVTAGLACAVVAVGLALPDGGSARQHMYEESSLEVAALGGWEFARSVRS